MNPNLFVALQHLAPHHLLSRLVGVIASSKSKAIHQRMIPWFANRYQVNMSEAEREDFSEYESFNDFFTRALKTQARVIDNGPDTKLISPVDAEVSQAGPISSGRIVQAKGMDFSVLELLGGNPEIGARFQQGSFTTLYLSPRDYHRIHMPTDGKLKYMAYVPGRLFSVNQITAQKVPGLFARNERVVCIFDTPQGEIAMVLVGAMIVASIETVWAGEVAPLRRKVQETHYTRDQPIELSKAEEMGRFKLGSTVVLLSSNPDIQWDSSLIPGVKVQLGQKIA